MKKILNYIAAGQGLGIKFLILFSAIFALIVAIYIRFAGADLIPYAQDIADQMLPVKVVNGIVVEPADTIKTAHLNLDENSDSIELPFIINTTVDNFDISQLSQGVYLSRKAFYVINQNDTRIYPLKGNFELPRGDYRDDFKSGLSWAAFIFFIFGGFGLFVFYFILSLFYAGCSYALSAFTSKKFDFDLRMRLSVLCLICVYTIFSLIGWMGIESGRLVFFVVVLALQAIVFSKLSSNQPEQASPAVSEDKAAELSSAKLSEKEEPAKIAATTKTAASKKTPAKKAPAKKPVTAKKPAAKAAKAPEKKTIEKKSPHKKVAPAKKTAVK